MIVSDAPRQPWRQIRRDGRRSLAHVVPSTGSVLAECGSKARPQEDDPSHPLDAVLSGRWVEALPNAECCERCWGKAHGV